MKRNKPLKSRTGFQAKVPPRRPEKRMDGYTIKARATAVFTGTARLDVAVPRPKAEPLQHHGYIDIVRGMACMHCRRPPRSQFCHADEGKGTGVKTDCRLGWPGCADAPGRPGCHTLIGTTRIYPKAQRREIEATYGARTRKHVRDMGLWPKRLPHWPGDDITEEKESTLETHPA